MLTTTHLGFERDAIERFIKNISATTIPKNGTCLISKSTVDGKTKYTIKRVFNMPNFITSVSTVKIIVEDSRANLPLLI